jgi:type IV pilus assembly protein PilF
MRNTSAVGWLALAAIAALLMDGCGGTQSRFAKPQPDKASDINLELGVDYLRKGNLSEAKDKIERALSQNPRNAKAHSAAGMLYSRLNDVDKADSHFDRAIALGDNNAEILNTYAAFLCTHDRYDKGEKVALKAAGDQLYKTPEIAYLNAGNCARNGGRPKDAEDSYRRALKASPRFGAALFQMADLAYSQNEFMSARAFLERYQSVARVSASSLWLAVRIERGLGNTRAANDYARRLRDDYPSSPEVRALTESERKAG